MSVTLSVCACADLGCFDVEGEGEPTAPSQLVHIQHFTKVVVVLNFISAYSVTRTQKTISFYKQCPDLIGWIPWECYFLSAKFGVIRNVGCQRGCK